MMMTVHSLYVEDLRSPLRVHLCKWSAVMSQVPFVFTRPRLTTTGHWPAVPTCCSRSCLDALCRRRAHIRPAARARSVLLQQPMVDTARVKFVPAREHSHPIALLELGRAHGPLFLVTLSSTTDHLSKISLSVHLFHCVCLRLLMLFLLRHLILVCC